MTHQLQRLTCSRLIALAGTIAVLSNPVLAQDKSRNDSLAQGKALFDARCGICHDKGGIGTFMLGKRLGEQHSLLTARTDIPAALIEQAVRNGINSMPGFTRVELTDAELKSISDYLTRPKRAR